MARMHCRPVSSVSATGSFLFVHTTTLPGLIEAGVTDTDTAWSGRHGPSVIAAALPNSLELRKQGVCAGGARRPNTNRCRGPGAPRSCAGSPRASGATTPRRIRHRCSHPGRPGRRPCHDQRVATAGVFAGHSDVVHARELAAVLDGRRYVGRFLRAIGMPVRRSAQRAVGPAAASIRTPSASSSAPRVQIPRTSRMPSAIFDRT